MLRKHYRLLALIAVLLMVFSWSVVQAEPPVVSFPAHKQVMNILGNLRDSEAEYASGAYIPGVGAVITIDLLRGPNSVKNTKAEIGTRDWAIYLMKAFGPKLDAVPDKETIAFSINYYDYATVVYHQLVVTSLAGDVKSPEKYQIYLDGKTFGQSGNAQPAAATTAAATAKAGATPQATTAQGASTAKATAGVTATTPGTATANSAVNTTEASSGPSGPVKLNFDFADPQKSIQDWIILSGKWSVTNNLFQQDELGKFDLMTLYNQPLKGDLLISADIKYLEGDFGGGLVLYAPAKNSKVGATMVSYTGKGTFVHWGYFAAGGIFQYQGGSPVANGSDGKPHNLQVKLTGSTFDVSLDGKVIGQKIALNGTPSGYIGLEASTSRVVFDNIKVEGTR